jgi:hypothetical protein
LVKDVRGYWYDVGEEALNHKKLDQEKARGVITAERAEKQKNN